MSSSCEEEESHGGCEGRSRISPEERRCVSRNDVNHRPLFILQTDEAKVLQKWRTFLSKNNLMLNV